MPRESDIPCAFMRAVSLNARSVRMVTTVAFRRELLLVNHDWTLQRCNAWIVRNQTFFMDVTDGDGTDRTYILRNMGRVL